MLHFSICVFLRQFIFTSTLEWYVHIRHSVYVRVIFSCSESILAYRELKINYSLTNQVCRTGYIWQTIYISDGIGSEPNCQKILFWNRSHFSVRSRSECSRTILAFQKIWWKCSRRILNLISTRSSSTGFSSTTRRLTTLQDSLPWSDGWKATCCPKCWKFR